MPSSLVSLALSFKGKRCIETPSVCHYVGCLCSFYCLAFKEHSAIFLEFSFAANYCLLVFNYSSVAPVRDYLTF